MNQGSNNYNQSFNNQSNNPTQPVKNKFFNFDLENNSNQNVGATTSSGTSNVISWGVGKKESSTTFNNQDNNLNQVNSVESLDIFGINQVNGGIFNGGNVETLDSLPNNTNGGNNVNQFWPQSNTNILNNQNNNQTNFINNEVLESDLPKLNNNYVNNMMNMQNSSNGVNNFINSNSNNINQLNGQVSPIFAEAQNVSNQLQNNEQINSVPTMSQQSMQNSQGIQNQGWQNGLGTQNLQGTEWMNNQPLSAASLGGASLNAENQPRDVVEQSRFFNANINNEMQNKQNNVQQFAMQYGNGVGAVLDDPPPVFDEMSSLKQFIGNDFTKLSMSIFSFSTFLFGSLIFLYRKMYMLGIILTLLETGISIFVPVKYSIVAILVIHIILALMVNPMYINSSKKKVKAILIDKNNMKKNQVEIDNLCHKKGKKNLLIALIIYIVCCCLMYTISSFTNITESIGKVMDSVASKKSNEKEEEPEVKEKTFNVEEYINIVMPNEFIKEDKSYYSYVYVTDETKKDSSCEISIDRLKNVNDVEDYIVKLRDKYNIVENVGMNIINEITWYTVINKNDNGKTYYRATKIQDISLLLEYRIGPEADSNICEMNYSKIISSIKELEEES